MEMGLLGAWRLTNRRFIDYGWCLKTEYNASGTGKSGVTPARFPPL
jgi:hypothetical protein